MAIKVKFFGILAEKMPAPEMTIENSGILADLVAQLKQQYQQLDQYVWICAVNQTVEHDLNTQLNNGDEIAFMPPFAGG